MNLLKTHLPILLLLLTLSLFLSLPHISFIFAPQGPPHPHIYKPYPVKLAYLISASTGDTHKLKRLILALYHPGNLYLIHIDGSAPEGMKEEIGEFVGGLEKYGENVGVIGKSNRVSYRGPTMVSSTLQGMAIMLRRWGNWDWFINLSASDYPLVTQDDLIDAFSGMPRNLNFIQHTSHLGWKLNKRGKPIIMDPALYSVNESEIWWVIKQRSLPSSFKLYTGSAWMILSRSFVEYCIVGWENLPRTLLLYFTNFVSSPEFYFQTLICNSRQIYNTTINHDLHYITWDTPPKQHPRTLGLKDYRKMVLSNRPFARKFKPNSLVLNKIDRELLKRTQPNGFSYGGWCSGDGCKLGSTGETFGLLMPGVGARRVKSLLTKLLATNYRRQCK